MSRMYEALLRSLRSLSILVIHPGLIVCDGTGADPRADQLEEKPRTKEVNTGMLSNLYLRLRELMVRNQDEDQEGQGMVEYALILVLIAVVVIVILTVVGKQNISSGLGT
jgi:Flp pilus assembly pilin Flp